MKKRSKKYLTVFTVGLSLISIAITGAVATFFFSPANQAASADVSHAGLALIFPNYANISELMRALMVLTAILLPIAAVSAIWALKMACDEINRTAIENKKCKEQYKMAEELSLKLERRVQLLSKLTGRIAIEFCNMLAPIAFSAGRMQASIRDDDPLKSDANDIYESSRRALDVIQKFTLAGGGWNDYTKAPLSLDKILPHIIETIRIGKPRYIVINEEYNFNREQIMGVLSQITTLLVNLCMNSYESIMNTISDDDGAGHIRVYGGVLTREGVKYARISIIDDGAGIEKNHVTQIFDPFFTTKQTGNGMGLGLTIAKSIVEYHGGLIRAENVLDQGAAFTVDLPVINFKENDMRHRINTSGAATSTSAIDASNTTVKMDTLSLSGEAVVEDWQAIPALIKSGMPITGIYKAFTNKKHIAEDTFVSDNNSGMDTDRINGKGSDGNGGMGSDVNCGTRSDDGVAHDTDDVAGHGADDETGQGAGDGVAQDADDVAGHGAGDETVQCAGDGVTNDTVQDADYDAEQSIGDVSGKGAGQEAIKDISIHFENNRTKNYITYREHTNKEYHSNSSSGADRAHLHGSSGADRAHLHGSSGADRAHLHGGSGAHVQRAADYHGNASLPAAGSAYNRFIAKQRAVRSSYQLHVLHGYADGDADANDNAGANTDAHADANADAGANADAANANANANATAGPPEAGAGNATTDGKSDAGGHIRDIIEHYGSARLAGAAMGLRVLKGRDDKRPTAAYNHMRGPIGGLHDSGDTLSHNLTSKHNKAYGNKDGYLHLNMDTLKWSPSQGVQGAFEQGAYGERHIIAQTRHYNSLGAHIERVGEDGALNIAVVDDNEMILKTIEQALAPCGHSVRVYGNPFKALDALRREPCDLIIISYRMKLMSGTLLAELIKNSNSADHVLLLTDNTDGNVTNLIRREQIDGFLKKPVSINELMDKVSAVSDMSGNSGND